MVRRSLLSRAVRMARLSPSLYYQRQYLYLLSIPDKRVALFRDQKNSAFASLRLGVRSLFLRLSVRSLFLRLSVWSLFFRLGVAIISG
jgi:hypothetical protein